MPDTPRETDLTYEEELEEYRNAVKKYIRQCIFMEGSKIVIFLIIFAYLKLIPQFFVALLALMMVRCNGGGLHCKHYISCLLLSFFVLAGCVYCGMSLPVPKLISIIVLACCSVIGYLIAPIVSSNRPEPDDRLIRQSKLRTFWVIFIYCLVICICPYNPYLNIGTWTVIIHIIQLLLAKFIQRR